MKDDNASHYCPVSKFKRAVCTMRSFSDVMHDMFPAIPTTCDDDHESTGSPTALGFCFDPSDDQHPLGLTGLTSEAGYVYNRPLLLPTNLSTITNRTDMEAFGLMVSTTVIFNLALAWHQFAAITGAEAPLFRAGKIYDFIVQVLDRDDEDDASRNVMRCVALNNRAQIFYQQADYVSSQMCMGDVFELLSMSEHLETYLGETEAQEIRFNIFHLSTPSVARAA